MHAYAYFLLGLLLSMVWGVVWYFRKDLRNKLYTSSAIGALLGPLSQYWYFADYWIPPRILAWHSVSIEDVLFGAVILGLSAVLYEAVSGRKPLTHDISRVVHFIGLLIVCALGIFVFVDLLGYPIVYVSSLLFLLASFFMIAHRTDLFVPSIATGGLLLLVILPLYLLLFEIFFQDFWHMYWQHPDWIVSDSLPLGVLFWHFSLGCVGGIASHFLRGTAPLFAPSITKLILKRGLGVLCVGVGIISLVTPFTPGSWLAIIGLELLGLGFLIPKRFRKAWEDWKEKILDRLPFRR